MNLAQVGKFISVAVFVIVIKTNQPESAAAVGQILKVDRKGFCYFRCFGKYTPVCIS